MPEAYFYSDEDEVYELVSTPMPTLRIDYVYCHKYQILLHAMPRLDMLDLSPETK